MQWLVEIGLSNAVAALVLAAVAWCVGRLVRQPAVTHVLCVLVLLRLLTPPIIEIPLPLPIGPAAVMEGASKQISASAERREARSATGSAGPSASPAVRPIEGITASNSTGPVVVDRKRPIAGAPITVFAAPRNTLAVDQANNGETQRSRTNSVDSQIVESPAIESAARDRSTSSLGSTQLAPALLGIWIAGTAAWFVLQLALVLRLRSNLRTAVPAPLEVRKAAEQLAVRMGLRRSPPVWVVTTACSPMLCGLGKRTCVVIPAALLDRLSPEARATVLAHELAHYRRGDQWVRLIELVATGLFWWHPVVWWVRHQIETTEEQCCDAHVLRECRGAARVYAEAILDIVDFLSEPARRMRPVMASGIRQQPLLQRRLRELMVGTCPPTVAPRSRRMIAIAGALGLFYHPTFFVTPAATARSVSVSVAQEELTNWRAAKPLPVPPSRLPAMKRTRGEMPTSGRHPKESEFTQTSLREVWATAISPNGRHQISIRPGYECELHEVITGRINPLDGQIVCVAFTPDSSRVVTGERDGSVRLWDAVAGSELGVLDRRPGPVFSVDWSAEVALIAAAGEDGTVRLLPLGSSGARAVTIAASGPVRCVRFSPSGHQLVVAIDTWQASRGGRLAVYDLRKRTWTHEWTTDAPLGAVQFLSQDALLAADWSGRVVRWSASRQLVTGTTFVAKELVSAASFSADTRALEAVAEEMDGRLQLGWESEGSL